MVHQTFHLVFVPGLAVCILGDLDVAQELNRHAHCTAAELLLCLVRRLHAVVRRCSRNASFGHDRSFVRACHFRFDGLQSQHQKHAGALFGGGFHIGIGRRLGLLYCLDIGLSAEDALVDSAFNG